MNTRKAATWRLSSDNYDWLYREMNLRQQTSINATLNAILADYRTNQQLIEAGRYLREKAKSAAGSQ